MGLNLHAVSAFEVSPSGHTASPSPGDFLLCHRRGIVSAIIRWGERLRFRSGSRWSHAVFVETSTTIIEALARGVVRTPLESYHNTEYVLVRTGLSIDDAAQAVAFARSCLGDAYGWATIIGDALRFLTPGRGIWFGAGVTRICSGLVANTQVRGWMIYDEEPSSMSPAELAEAHDVPDKPGDLP
jgi:hypothetical protein